MGKKSWGETLRTTGVKFQSESEVQRWHSANQNARMALCTLQSATLAHRTDGSKYKILTRREYFALNLYANGLRLRFFTHFGRPIAENYESVFLNVVRPVGAFDRCASKIYFWSFWGATMGQIFKISTTRDFGPLRQWSRKFPARIFYPFWAPHGQNLGIDLFERRGTK